MGEIRHTTCFALGCARPGAQSAVELAAPFTVLAVVGSCQDLARCAAPSLSAAGIPLAAHSEELYRFRSLGIVLLAHLYLVLPLALGGACAGS